MKRIFVISVFFIFAICFVSIQSYAAGSWTGNVNIFYGSKTLNSDDWSVTGDDYVHEVTIEDQEYTITLAQWVEQDFNISVDKGSELGVNADFGPKSWPVCFTVGFFKASSDESWSGSSDTYTFTDPESGGTVDVTFFGDAKLKASTQELRLGVKKIFEVTSSMHPYVAGGLAEVRAKANLPFSMGDDYVHSIYGAGSYLESYHNSFSDSAIGYWLSGGAYWTFAKQYNVGIEFSYSKATVDFGNSMELETGGLHYGLFAGIHW